MSPARLEQLTDELRKRPLERNYLRFIDLAERYGGKDLDNKVAYALTTVESAQTQQVLLRTGSDDALRIWLNGQLVTAKPKLRAAKVDEDQTPVLLRRGHNEIVVEVSNSGGGWGFYFRFTDQRGQSLVVAPDGSLAPFATFYDPRSFVRSWRLSPTPLPWPSTNEFVALSPERRQQLATELREQPQETSRSPYIDLLLRYRGLGVTDNKVAYALSTIESDHIRQATLLTGSDDALRVWINGELVVDKLELRAAEIDNDRTAIMLRQGSNEVLVEVSNSGGGWGFFFRLQE